MPLIENSTTFDQWRKLTDKILSEFIERYEIGESALLGIAIPSRLRSIQSNEYLLTCSMRLGEVSRIFQNWLPASVKRCSVNYQGQAPGEFSFLRFGSGDRWNCLQETFLAAQGHFRLRTK